MIKHFKTEDEFKDYQNSDEFSENTISYISANGELHFGSSQEGGMPNKFLYSNKENNKRIYDYLKSLNLNNEKLEYIDNSLDVNVFKMKFGTVVYELYSDGRLDNTSETA